MNVQARLSILLLTTVAIAFAPADGRAEGTPGVFFDMSADLTDLDAFRWKNRPVLLFAPSPDDPSYVEQRAALNVVAKDLLERDIVVLSDADPSGNGVLRLLFGVQGFEVLLVGKDGGVKPRRREPITAEALSPTSTRCRCGVGNRRTRPVAPHKVCFQERRSSIRKVARFSD